MSVRQAILARKPGELNPPYAGRRVAAGTGYKDGGVRVASPSAVIPGEPPELEFTRVRQYQLSKSATADLDGASPEMTSLRV